MYSKYEIKAGVFNVKYFICDAAKSCYKKILKELQYISKRMMFIAKAFQRFCCQGQVCIMCPVGEADRGGLCLVVGHCKTLSK